MQILQKVEIKLRLGLRGDGRWLPTAVSPATKEEKKEELKDISPGKKREKRRERGDWLFPKDSIEFVFGVVVPPSDLSGVWSQRRRRRPFRSYLSSPLSKRGNRFSHELPGQKWASSIDLIPWRIMPFCRGCIGGRRKTFSLRLRSCLFPLTDLSTATQQRLLQKKEQLSENRVWFHSTSLPILPLSQFSSFRPRLHNPPPS